MNQLSRRRSMGIISVSAVIPCQIFGYDEKSPTLARPEGPAYKPGAPFRNDIITPGTPGRKFGLESLVMDTHGKALEGATVDLWNVRNDGTYDFEGFNLRGRQNTAKSGWAKFLTIEAIPYSGRTAHFHFKVSAPGYQLLTTELYLPDLPQNQRDSMFNEVNVLHPMEEGGLRKSVFAFVLRPL